MGLAGCQGGPQLTVQSQGPLGYSCWRTAPAGDGQGLHRLSQDSYVPVPLLSARSASNTDKYGGGGIPSGASHLKRVSGQVQRPANLWCNSWNPQEPPPGRARQLGVPSTNPL